MRPAPRIPGGRRATILALAGLTAGALALAGCSSSKASTSTGPSASVSATPAADGTFPATAGGTTVSARPAHIVSLSPTATDMLHAIGADSQVTAVDLNSDYPGPPAMPKGDLDAYKPNAEAIAAKNPDLVVISDDTNKIKEQLQKLNIPVYTAPAAMSLADTYQQEKDLGTLTGHVSAAAKVASDEDAAIKAAIAKVPARAKPLTFYYELDPTYYSVTSKTFIGSLFTMAGMTNIADASDPDGKAYGYPQLSAEVIVKANPDLIFLADTQCCKQSQTTVAARPGWSTIGAVKNSHVVAIPDDVASQWGTRVTDLVNAIVAADQAVPVS